MHVTIYRFGTLVYTDKAERDLDAYFSAKCARVDRMKEENEERKRVALSKPGGATETEGLKIELERARWQVAELDTLDFAAARHGVRYELDRSDTWWWDRSSYDQQPRLAGDFVHGLLREL